MKKVGTERQRDRETEGQRETERQKDRETERQRDREKVRQRDKKIITCITWLGFWVVCRSVDDHNYKETKV